MCRKVRLVSTIVFVLMCSLVLLPGQAWAAGFQLMEQSARGIGYGFAGSAAGYGDGSSVFYNPAALSRLSDPVMTFGVHTIMPSARFSNEGSHFVTTGAPMSGGNGGDGAETGFVPNFYYALPLSEESRTVLGLGINAPFGLATDYPDNWVGRYNALETELATLNLNPGLSYQATDWVSVGAGVSAVYLDAKLSQAVDFGSIVGAGPQVLDGTSTVEGDDWAYGWNIGILFALAEDSHLGLSYRSKVDSTLNGDITWNIPPPAQPVQATGAFLNGGGKVDLTLPETASLGGSHRLNESLALLGEVAWTRWSQFDEIRVVADNPNQPDAVIDESWDDAFRLSLGLDYLLNDEWTLRGGLTYDQTPVPDDQHRTPRIPDMDRYWVALGLGFNATENVTVDLGYVHIFVEDGDTDIMGPTGSRLIGSWDSDVNIVSLSVSWMM